MAKKWSEVLASPDYQGLSDADKETARNQYFDDQVAPQVDPADIDTARSEFLSSTSINMPEAEDTGPSFLEKAASVAATGGAALTDTLLGITESIFRTPEAVERLARAAPSAPPSSYVAAKTGDMSAMPEQKPDDPRGMPQTGVEAVEREGVLGGLQYYLRQLGNTVADKQVEARAKLRDAPMGIGDVFKRLDEKSQVAEQAFQDTGVPAAGAEVFAPSLEDVGKGEFSSAGQKLLDADYGKAGEILGQGEWGPLAQAVKDPETLIAAIAQAVPSMYAAIKGGIPAITWLEGMSTASDAADFEKKTGVRMTDDQFAQAVLQTAAVNTLLEKTGLDEVMHGSGGILRRGATGALVEGATEGLQSVNQNLAEKFAFDPNKPVSEGVLMSILGGAGSGGPVATYQGIVDKLTGGEGATPAAPPPGGEAPPMGAAQDAPSAPPSEVERPGSFRKFLRDLTGSTTIGAPVNTGEEVIPSGQEEQAYEGQEGRQGDVLEPPVAEPAPGTAERIIADLARGEPAPMEGDGTRANPAKVQAEDHLGIAGQQVNTEPTDAQKEAGNYKKAHVKFQGLDITIENPKGSVRSGVDENGEKWEAALPADYGYIKRTKGADGEHLDVYVGPNPESGGVAVIDQRDLKTGKFDEHKALVGFNTVEEAKQAYTEAFTDGKGADRIGGVTTMSPRQFKQWTKNGDLQSPVSADFQEGTQPTAENVPGREETAAISTQGDEKLPIGNDIETKSPEISSEVEDEGDLGEVISLPNPKSKYPMAEVAVRQSGDGKWQYRSTLNLPDRGTTSPFFGAYETREEAMRAASDSIRKHLDVQESNPASVKKGIKRVNDWLDKNAPAAKPAEEEAAPPADKEETAAQPKEQEKADEGADTTEEASNTPESDTGSSENAGQEQDAAPAEDAAAPTEPVDKGKSKTEEEAPQNPASDEGGERGAEPGVKENPPSGMEEKINTPEPIAKEDEATEPEKTADLSTDDVDDKDVAETEKTEEEEKGDTTVRKDRTVETSPKKPKLQDVGEAMAGKRAQAKEQITKGLTDDARADAQRILDRASRTQHWKVELSEGATVGTRTYLEGIRAKMKPLSEHIGKKAGGGRRKWQDSFKEALMRRVDRDGTKDLEDAAADYIAVLQQIEEATKGAMTVEQARAALHELFFVGENEEELTDFGKQAEGYFGDDFRGGKRQLAYFTETGKYGYSAYIHDDKEGKAKAKPMVRPKLENMERVGMKDYRQGKDVTGQDMIDTFGFRGVEFGEWVNAAERQANVNHAYDALYDLADTLGIPPKGISLGGQLGFAFGSRGKGEHAAHYEPGNKVINLTKTKGDGSVAHEWGHALDFILSETTAGKRAVESLTHMLSTNYDAKGAQSNLNGILRGNITVKGGKKLYTPMELAERFLKSLWHNRGWGVMSDTSYVRESRKLGKEYWANPKEMWARAFESMVFDRIEGGSPYLVSPWVQEGTVSPANGYKGTAFPVGEERSAFKEYFKQFLDGISWDDSGLPSMKEGYVPVGDVVTGALKTTFDAWIKDLPAINKRLVDGDPGTDGLWWYEFEKPGGRGPGRAPKGYVAHEDGQGNGMIGYSEALDVKSIEEYQLRRAPAYQPGEKAVYLKEGLDAGAGSDKSDAGRVAGEEALGGAPAEDDGAAQEGRDAERSPRDRSGARQDDDRGTDQQSGDGRGGGKGSGVSSAYSSSERGGAARARPGPGSQGLNYRITDADQIGMGGPKAKFKDNIEAIRTLKKVEDEGRLATEAEQKALVKYVGWGGLPQVFSPYDNDWQAEKAQLAELLTDAELDAARASTTNAHYTAPGVIRAMWDGLKRFGFDGGRVLEPAVGVGHFFGLMPESLAKNSQLTAVELDSLSARIAAQLYQRANVMNKGYQETGFPENFFDVIISNVPFSDSDKPVDRRYNKLGLNLHDYYFAKSMKLVRPGGIVAFITSKGTMDKIDMKARKLISQDAELLGAIRLPETAFEKNAGTTVTTDVIFLRKPVPGEKREGQAWLDTKRMEVPDQSYQTGTINVDVNEYYVANPDMMLGTLALRKSRYGHGSEVALIDDGRNLVNSLTDTIAKLPESSYLTSDRVNELETAALSVPAEGDVKDGAFTERNGKLYARQGELFIPVEEKTPKEKKRGQIIRASMAIRDATRSVLRAQIDDQDAGPSRKVLGKAYDSFVKKYGYLNVKANVEAFADDPDASLLLALEHWDIEKQTATKADIFTKNTMQRYQPVGHTDNATDALAVSLNENGRIDWDHISRLTGLSIPDAREKLKGQVYNDPVAGWVTAENYLSGNVREKLKVAQGAAEADPVFEENVRALEAVQPEDLAPADIDARLGAPWIPTDLVKEFAAELMDTYVGRIRVNFSDAAGIWTIEPDTRPMTTTVEAASTWGTPKVNFYDLMSYALNGGFPRVMTPKDSEGKSYLDKEATEAANTKLREIKDRFARWAWEDSVRANNLARKYNDEYNAIRLRKYKYPAIPGQVDDHGRVRLPGMAAGMALNPHQAAAVWRGVESGNMFAAHDVGTGKTFTMTALAMEARRLGVSRKPMIAVLNSTIEQFKTEFLRLYPGANILALKISEKKDERKKQLNRIATNAWDAVIVTHESYAKIPVSAATLQENLGREIEALEMAILSAQADTGSKSSRIVKQIEAAKRSLENKMKKLLEQKEKDDVLSFEELGVDMIMVDEAQEYKNLMFATKLGRQLKGLNPEGSARAFDLYMKTNYLNDNFGRGVVFASGTPLSNSVAELYTWSRYLQPQELRKRGLMNFDMWANTFGDIGQTAEYLPEGGGYQMVTKFRQFVNIGELLQMVYGVMDAVKADDTGIKRPKMKTGKPIPIIVPQNEGVAEYQEELKARAIKIRQGPRAALPDMMLKVVSDGRKAAMDMRLVDPASPDYDETKTNYAVKIVKEIYDDTAKDKGTILIFSDLGVPGEDKFSVYGDLKQKLVKMGIPAEEIAFVHDAKNDRERKILFSKVRSGQVRVFVGSTKKAGTGVNVQDRAAALVNMDTHWNWANIEQRIGRGIRQGNMFDEVGVYFIATEGTVDAFMWDKVQAKGRLLNRIMSGDLTLRRAEDISRDTMSASEMVAVSSGDPRIAEKVQLESDVQRLESLTRSYTDNKRRLQSRLASAPEQIASSRSYAASYTKDAEALSKVKSIRIGNDTYELEDDEQRKKLDEALETHLKGLKKGDSASERGVTIGATDNGLPVLVRRSFTDNEYVMVRGTSGDMEWKSGNGVKRGLGLIQKDAGAKAESFARDADRLEKEIPKLQAEIEKPFDKEDEYIEKRQKLDDLTRELLAEDKQESVDDAKETTAAAEEEKQFAAYEPKPGAKKDVEEIKQEVLAAAKRINPKATVEFVDKLFGEGPELVRSGAPSEERREVSGAYSPWSSLIEISLDVSKYDPVKTGYHELWHSIRGVLSAEDQKTLEAAFPEKGKMSGEEREAYAFADFAKGMAGKYTPPVRRIFAKIRAFLTAIGNIFKAKKVRTVEDIFEDVFSGKMAERAGIVPPLDGDVRYSAEDPYMNPGAAGAPEMTAALSDRIADLYQGSKAQEILQSARQMFEDWKKAPDLRSSADINWFTKTMVHPRTIAKLYRPFAPVWRAAETMFIQRDQIATDLGKILDPFYQLGQESKRKVGAVLELGRLGKTIYKGEEIKVANGGIENARLSAPGEVIELNKEESAAYHAVREGMNKALDHFRDMLLREANYDPADQKTPKTSKQVERIIKELEAKMETAESEDRREINMNIDRHTFLRDAMAEIENAKRSGYVPFSRFGDYAVFVKDKDGETVWSESFEVGGSIGQKLKKGVIDAKRRELMKRFPEDEGYEVSQPFRLDSQKALQQASIDISSLDTLAHFSSLDPELYRGFREDLIQAQRAKGFRKHFFAAKDVPGYSEDFERAISDYVTSISGYISRRETQPKFKTAVEFIDPVKMHELRRYADQYIQYLQNPQEEFQRLRNIAFFAYLGGNISSALVNMTQVQVVTAPYLSAVADPKDVARELGKAYKDAAQMIKIENGRPVLKTDLAPADVREDMKAADARGDLVPQLTFEQMGIAQAKRKLLRQQRRKIANVIQYTADLYSTAERINRIVTYIAAHRIYQVDGVPKKANQVFGGTTLWQPRKANADSFATWVIDETHFKLGKVNRPKLMRGIGAPLFQFKSFIINMLETEYILATKMGPEGKKAFALHLAVLFLFAGMFGLPFGDDLRDLMELTYKGLTDEDLDIEKEVREFFLELDDSGLLGDMFTRGPARSLGVDVSKRIGMGQILPMKTLRSLMTGENTFGAGADVLGVPYEMTIGRGSRAIEAFKDGRILEGVAEFMPNFIRNPMIAYSWSREGVTTRTGRTVMPEQQITKGDVILKAIGFTPTSISRFREIEYMKRRSDNAVTQLQSRYYERLSRAIADADDAKVQEIVKEIEEHNDGADLNRMVIIDPGYLTQKVTENMLGAEVRKGNRKGAIERENIEKLNPDKDRLMKAIENGDQSSIRDGIDSARQKGQAYNQKEIRDMIRLAGPPELQRIMLSSDGPPSPKMASVYQDVLAAG